METIHTLRLSLESLCAFRELLDAPVLSRFAALLLAADRGDAESGPAAWGEFYYALRQENAPSLACWLWDALRYQDSPYGLLTARGDSDPALTQAAARDLDILRRCALLDPAELADKLGSLARSLPRWEVGGPELDFRALTRFYQTHGCGQFARYRAFRWTADGLLPIPEPDSPQPWELLGYERERRTVADNARALLEGRQVNHVLLYGESGTGKSATVKSLLSLPGFEALRIVELDRDALTDIPALVRLLGTRPQKFILFLDDLSFDQDDKTYSQLKTILEGSLEKRPGNVVVYATSNRRNLVRQTFSDRLGDEVDAAETVSEKTSLAERFGVRVPYLALDPREFLSMVRQMARLYHVDLDPAELDDRAKKWLLRHPGRTPRIARQFIASLLS